MRSGIIFDIKEFAVHDGPGIRTTVFLKGCPLRCQWCHNPEGIRAKPQEMQSSAGKRTVGRKVMSDELSALLNGQADILKENEGGVTFSGGEPLLQDEFLLEVIEKLEDLHVLIDTSGCVGEETFRAVLQKVDLVHYDLKLMDPGQHRKYTMADNSLSLRNLLNLSRSGVPYIVRIPLVPGVTDTIGNLTAIADKVQNLDGLLRVEMLPYNKAAGGKYRACGMEFQADYNENEAVNADVSIFEKRGITARVT
jgi:pyruvate formate lyase activating enzyme